MSPLVVDASVAAKWVLDEEHSDKASTLLQSNSLYAPAHWSIEAVNAIWGYVRRGSLTVSKAGDCMTTLMRAPVLSVPVADLMPQALALSIAHSVTIYDSLYVALAVARDLPLVTADRRLIRSMSADAALGRRLLWVGDLASA